MRYLRDVHFNSDFALLAADKNGHIRGKAGRTASRIGMSPKSRLPRAQGLVDMAVEGQEDRPPGIVDPRRAVYLTTGPGNAPGPDLLHGHLGVEIARDPRALLWLGEDNATTREGVIAVAARALARLEAWDGRFPAAGVRKGIVAFRRSAHAFASRAGRGMIPGTRV